MARATGLARNTILAVARDVEQRRAHLGAAVTLRVRAPGGGRKPLTETDPELRATLEALVDPAIRAQVFQGRSRIQSICQVLRGRR